MCNTQLEGLPCLAAFGNEQIILLCIAIQSVKVLAAFLTQFTHFSYQEMQDIYSLSTLL